MRKTIIKALASSTLALATICATVPAEPCLAYSENDYVYIAPQEATVKIDFVILRYSEDNGELTITGCYDYSEDIRVNPLTGGYIALAVVNGILEIPSHIDGKPVVDIRYLSNNSTFDTIIVPDAITKILRTAFGDKLYSVETAERECRVVTMYC